MQGVSEWKPGRVENGWPITRPPAEAPTGPKPLDSTRDETAPSGGGKAELSLSEHLAGLWATLGLGD
jgi:hypothetical protein